MKTFFSKHFWGSLCNVPSASNPPIPYEYSKSLIAPTTRPSVSTFISHCLCGPTAYPKAIRITCYLHAEGNAPQAVLQVALRPYDTLAEPCHSKDVNLWKCPKLKVKALPKCNIPDTTGITKKCNRRKGHLPRAKVYSGLSRKRLPFNGIVLGTGHAQVLSGFYQAVSGITRQVVATFLLSVLRMDTQRGATALWCLGWVAGCSLLRGCYALTIAYHIQERGLGLGAGKQPPEHQRPHIIYVSQSVSQLPPELTSTPISNVSQNVSQPKKPPNPQRIPICSEN